MNPIDRFSALRPEVDDLSDAELASIWAATSSGRSTWNVRRRRMALAGAAASIIVGVGALVLVDERAAAPVSTTPVSTLPAVTSVAATTVPPTTPGDAITSPPVWSVTADGWTLTEYHDQPYDRKIALFAGPGGVEMSWVAVFLGMSDPLVSGPGQYVEPEPSDEAIVAERHVNASGNFVVSAGGVSADVANEVFDAWMARSDPPSGFVEIPSSPAADSMRTISYRFENGVDDSIWIDVQAGGVPRFEVESASATAAESDVAPAGVDDALISDVGDRTLIVRTGFWVSRIRTSAAPDDMAEFLDLVGLVDLNEAAPPIDRLAIGDSVMLGAAEQLGRSGFAVDATESRVFVDGLDLVRMLESQGRLPSTMVVHLGENGPIRPEDLDEMMGILADVDDVRFLTTLVDRQHAPVNNELLRELPERYGNVGVIDWAALADDCPGDCFESDGLHLKPDGREYYAALLVDV